MGIVRPKARGTDNRRHGSAADVLAQLATSPDSVPLSVMRRALRWPVR